MIRADYERVIAGHLATIAFLERQLRLKGDIEDACRLLRDTNAEFVDRFREELHELRRIVAQQKQEGKL